MAGVRLPGRALDWRLATCSQIGFPRPVVSVAAAPPPRPCSCPGGQTGSTGEHPRPGCFLIQQIGGHSNLNSTSLHVMEYSGS